MKKLYELADDQELLSPGEKCYFLPRQCGHGSAGMTLSPMDARIALLTAPRCKECQKKFEMENPFHLFTTTDASGSLVAARLGDENAGLLCGQFPSKAAAYAAGREALEGNSGIGPGCLWIERGEEQFYF